MNDPQKCSPASISVHPCVRVRRVLNPTMYTTQIKLPDAPKALS